jgi:hypothetical protein
MQPSLSFLLGYLEKESRQYFSPESLRTWAKDNAAGHKPTDAQKHAGNYKKFHMRVQGMDISIENPEGSTRSGTAPDGKRWSSTMKGVHYGYLKGTKSIDGDAVDVFLNPKNPRSFLVFVVNQIDPKSGAFDETKSLLGFRTKEEAKQAYLAQYEPGWQGCGSIVSTTLNKFKAWAYSPKAKKGPFKA